MKGWMLGISWLICFCHTSGMLAHPSYGLVITDEGTIYFSDVLHLEGAIWKLDSLGNLTHILRGQHSHFLFRDERNFIWGTNHEYLPRTESNRNTLWKLDKDENYHVVIPPTEDVSEFTGNNFVVDNENRIYYDYEGRIFIRDSTGQIDLFSTYQFERIMSLQIDDLNQIYVADNKIDGGSIFKINVMGVAIQLAGHLLEDNPADPPFPEKRFNMLWAIHLGDDQNIYIANSGSRRISKISKGAEVSHIYYSDPPWYPVAYYRKSNEEYIMETAYKPLRGNFGPRILKRTGEKVVVIADTDHSQKNYLKEHKPEGTKKGNFQNLFGLVLLIFLTITGLYIYKLRR